MVRVGQRVRFDPYEYITGYGSDLIRGTKVNGTIVMVNEEHRWFSVEYGDPKARTSFKFCDIGERVKVVG